MNAPFAAVYPDLSCATPLQGGVLDFRTLSEELSRREAHPEMPNAHTKNES